MNSIVIFIAHYKPGYLAGGPIQSVYNLSSLLSNNFYINIITQNFDFENKRTPYKLPKNKWILQKNGVNVSYSSSFLYNYCSIFKLFKIKPNTIYINSFFSRSSQINFLLSKIYSVFNKCEIIIAPRGEFDEGAISLKNRKKTIFIKVFKMLYRSEIKFHATTEIEKENILSKFKRSEITVAENIPKIKNNLSKTNKITNYSKFLFFSRISPKKNLLFCLDIFLKININGNIDFTIVGPFEDKTYWNECKNKIKLLPENIKCQVLGPMEPDLVEDVLKENHFLFFPTLAENFGHVIYESLIFGLPILISNNTPWVSERKENGVFAHSLNNGEAFIDDIEFLHGLGQESYNCLSENAYSFAKDKMNLKLIKNQYLNLFRDVKK